MGIRIILVIRIFLAEFKKIVWDSYIQKVCLYLDIFFIDTVTMPASLSTMNPTLPETLQTPTPPPKSKKRRRELSNALFLKQLGQWQPCAAMQSSKRRTT